MGVMFSMRVGSTITLIGATLDSGTIGSVFELLANQLCIVLFLFISIKNKQGHKLVHELIVTRTSTD